MTNDKRTLPDGYYKIEILDAIICENKNKNGHFLKIAYDIVEPVKFKDYFDDNYKNQQSENQRWNGFMYLTIPYPGQKYSSSVVNNTFKEYILALEKSNLRYKYDRKIASMVGLRLAAYIETQQYACSNGFKYGIKQVTKVCSLDEFEIERRDTLPFLDDIAEPNGPYESSSYWEE